VEKRLLSPEQAAALSPQEAVELIFHPGFSTAEKITEVSGRGVGMDVVRTTLREHDGDVTIDSVLGVGTTFTLTIPIRHAVLVVDGLLVRDGDATYVIPLEHLREIVEVRLSDLKSVHNSLVALVRGEPHAAIPLSGAFGSPNELRPDETYHGLVLQTKEGTLCLLTERVLGQRKVVINSLRSILPGIEKLAGVAQLGGGRLALVISAPDIVREVSHHRV
jgi:two-component system chemotaxis sensor kinase CheA